MIQPDSKASSIPSTPGLSSRSLRHRFHISIQATLNGDDPGTTYREFHVVYRKSWAYGKLSLRSGESVRRTTSTLPHLRAPKRLLGLRESVSHRAHPDGGFQPYSTSTPHSYSAAINKSRTRIDRTHRQDGSNHRQKQLKAASNRKAFPTASMARSVSVTVQPYQNGTTTHT